MSPISIEAKFANSKTVIKLEAAAGIHSRCTVGDRKIDLTGFGRGGEAVISRKDASPATENPQVITVKKSQSKNTSFEFTHKNGTKDTARVQFLGK